MRILGTYKKREITGLPPYEIPNHSQLNMVIMKTSTKVANSPVWQNLSIRDFEGEHWRDIGEYEGLYQVSNLGRVKSLGNGNSSFSKNKILKANQLPAGHLQYTLYKNGVRKMFLGHRLTAKAFIQNIKNYNVVHHIDENPKNNRVENLLWCTQRQNCNFGTRNIRTSKAMINGVTSKPILQISLLGEIKGRFERSELRHLIEIIDNSITVGLV